MAEKLFEYNHEHRGTSSHLEVFRSLLGDSDDVSAGVVLSVLESGKKVGHIEGRETTGVDGCKVFEAKISMSTQRADANDYVPIPRAVGATIAQCLLRRTFKTWISNNARSSYGTRMYQEFLANYPGIVVSREDDRFKVQALKKT